MKTIYIPKGETVCYDHLYAERIVVNGCLRVDHSLDAKVIGGKGGDPRRKGVCRHDPYRLSGRLFGHV